MRLELDRVGVGPERAPELSESSAVVESGRVTLLTVEGQRAPVVASLVAGARMRPDRGVVRFDGGAVSPADQARIALVDTPIVAEPAAGLPLTAVVREELSLVGAPHRRGRILLELDAMGLLDAARAPLATLPPGDRIRLLATLATRRDGVEAIVLTSPERHGGQVADWVKTALDLADRGFAVLVVAGAAATASAHPLLP